MADKSRPKLAPTGWGSAIWRKHYFHIELASLAISRFVFCAGDHFFLGARGIPTEALNRNSSGINLFGWDKIDITRSRQRSRRVIRISTHRWEESQHQSSFLFRVTKCNKVAERNVPQLTVFLGQLLSDWGLGSHTEVGYECLRCVPRKGLCCLGCGSIQLLTSMANNAACTKFLWSTLAANHQLGLVKSWLSGGCFGWNVSQ